VKVLFTNRIIEQWNQLPSYVVTADNLNVPYGKTLVVKKFGEKAAAKDW